MDIGFYIGILILMLRRGWLGSSSSPCSCFKASSQASSIRNLLPLMPAACLWASAGQPASASLGRAVQKTKDIGPVLCTFLTSGLRRRSLLQFDAKFGWAAPMRLLYASETIWEWPGGCIIDYPPTNYPPVVVFDWWNSGALSSLQTEGLQCEVRHHCLPGV